MKGIVRNINLDTGFVAVETANGYSILELLGWYDVKIEDILLGNFHSLGEELVLNETQSEEMLVIIQDRYCSDQHVIKLMQ